MKKIFKKLKKKICQRLQPKARKGWLWLIPIGISLLAAGGLWIWASTAGGIGKVVVEIVAWLSKILVGVLSWIIGLAVQAIIGVAQYNDFIKEPAVISGWEILRDIGNMFFIILFLVMAVGTILKKEQYSWQKMLIPLVLVAIFINFSKTICGLFIDFSQVIMLTFVNAFKDVGAGNLVDLFGLRQLLELSREGGTAAPTGVSDMGIAATYLLASIFAFVASVVMIVVVAVLILRIVALWFLVVLSPIAFIGYVVPGMQKYAKQWQEKFFSQVIVGPVLAFFLWLSFYAVQVGLQEGLMMGKEGYLEAGVSSDTSGVLPIIGSPRFLTIFILGSGMLIGALMAAKQLGVAGAGLAGQGIGFLQKSGATVVSKTAGWAARRADLVRQKAFKAGGSAIVGGLGAGFKSLAFLSTGRGKEIKGIWKEYKDKSLKPLISPLQRFRGMLSKGKTEANIARTQGWNSLLTPGGALAGKINPLSASFAEISNLYRRGLSGGLTQAEKNMMKTIIDSSTLASEGKEHFKTRIDEDFTTRELPTAREVGNRFVEGMEFFQTMLRDAGVSDPNARKDIISAIGYSQDGQDVMRAIREGGVDEKEAKRIIDSILDKISSGTITDTGTATRPGSGAAFAFDNTKIKSDVVKTNLEALVSILRPKSGRERAAIENGTKGIIEYEMDEIKGKHPIGSTSRTALDALDSFQTNIETRLRASLRAGSISITDKEGVKKQIEKDLNELVKKGILDENETTKIKNKLEFEIEAVPVARMTGAELSKQIVEKVGKWTGKKLSVPFSITAATLESLRDNAGIPIFDLDILLKDIKNFNARRTRRREADKLGQWHDVMNLWASWNKDKTDFKGIELMSRVGEEKKMVQDKTQGETHATLNELYDAWQSGDHAKAVGAYMILAENNDLNELWKGDFSGKFLPIMRKMLQTQYLGKTVKIWDERTRTETPRKINQAEIDKMIQTSREKGEVNLGFARLFTKNLTTLAGKSESVAAKLGNMIGMIALSNGSPHMGYAAASYNPKTEKMEFAPLEIQFDSSGRLDLTLSRRSMAEIKAKLKNISQRKVTQIIHPGMFAQEDINGAMRGLNALNKSYLMSLSSTLLERPHEMRDDIISKLTASPEFRNDISRLVSDMRADVDHYLRYYSDDFAKKEDVLKQAELIREFIVRLDRAKYQKRG